METVRNRREGGNSGANKICPVRASKHVSLPSNSAQTQAHRQPRTQQHSTYWTRRAFPAILAVADTLPVPLEVEFAFGLGLVIKGLDQLHGTARPDELA